MFFLEVVLLCTIYIGINCKPSVHPSIEKDDSSINITLKETVDTSITDKELRFKDWLVDTLRVITDSSTKKINKQNTPKREIIIGKDSLDLSIVNHYHDRIVPGIASKKKDVIKLLSLLKEYDEEPKGEFILKFSTSYYYAPSPLDYWPRDLMFEINNIEINEGNGEVISKYSYIRGRLAHKTVNITTEDGKNKYIYIDFVWNGNNLAKIRRN